MGLLVISQYLVFYSNRAPKFQQGTWALGRKTAFPACVVAGLAIKLNSGPWATSVSWMHCFQEMYAFITLLVCGFPHSLSADMMAVALLDHQVEPAS